MSYELVQQPAISVMGLFTRASNAELNEIGDLWRRFHAAGDHAIVEARLSDAHYCVYCEYEGDQTQAYTVVVGCEVLADATVAEDLKLVSIDAGKFAVYKRSYERPNPVFATWEEIWKTPLDRRYQADFDRYGPEGISVNVGVR